MLICKEFLAKTVWNRFNSKMVATFFANKCQHMNIFSEIFSYSLLAVGDTDKGERKYYAEFGSLTGIVKEQKNFEITECSSSL